MASVSCFTMQQKAMTNKPVMYGDHASSPFGTSCACGDTFHSASCKLSTAVTLKQWPNDNTSKQSRASGAAYMQVVLQSAVAPAAAADTHLNNLSTLQW